jgi:hypothetical protein
MLDAIEKFAPNRRKEVNSMKIAIALFAVLLLVGGFVGNGGAEVLSKTESTPGSNYCHVRFTAISVESLSTEQPVTKGADSGDIIDFYGPCDENPMGQDQIAAQKLDQLHRWEIEYAD